MRFAYADPPYLGHGAKDYGHRHPDAADYDDPANHVALIVRLVDEYPDGWAVSLDAPSLRFYLSNTPADCRIGIWGKTYHQILVNVSVQYAWEPVIWRGGRTALRRNPLVRDWIASNTARVPGFKGAKPQAFNRWVLDLLGYDATQDTLDDLFPGSGSMASALACQPLDFGDTA